MKDLMMVTGAVVSSLRFWCADRVRWLECPWFMVRLLAISVLAARGQPLTYDVNMAMAKHFTT
jgi:hypothetical protein